MNNKLEVYAHNKCEQAISMEKGIRASMFKFAEVLWEVKEKKLYETEYGTWHAFLENFVSLNASSAYKLIQAYQFCQQHKIPEKLASDIGGYTVLYDYARRNEATPTVKVHEDLLKFADAGFGKSDVRAAVIDPNCACDDYYTIRVCRHCGKRYKVEDSRHN
jgi:hypothetical protein